MAKPKLAAALARSQAPKPKVRSGLNPHAGSNRVEKEKKKKQQQQQNPSHRAVSSQWLPFDASQQILLVGEGDFSFAASILANGFAKRVLATCLDSVDELQAKYPEVAEKNMKIVDSYDSCKALTQINGTKLHTYKKKIPMQDVVMFNFPHLGNSVADQDRNIRQHQELMLKFFQSATLLTSHIVLTLWDGEPYNSWGIKKLARSCDLVLVRSCPFAWDRFTGYEHMLTSRTGNTSKPQKSRNARMFLFVKKSVAQESGHGNTGPTSKKVKRADSDSEEE